MTAQLAAAIAGDVPFAIPLFVLCTTLVIAWAIYLPTTVRDADKRKLAPNVPARLLFLFLYVLVYAALVAAFAFGGKQMVEWIDIGETSIWHTVLKAFEGQAPLLAVTVLTFLHSISYFRELEHGLIIWLHSALYLKGDIQTLALHLRKCSFSPSPVEREKNVTYLREFDVYVDDTDTSALQLEAVAAWRKTSTLLRLIRLWNPGRNDILDERDMNLLGDIEKAHARKTRLAMDIIRMLRHKERGTVSAEALTNLAMMLANASHRDRSEVAEIESRLKSAIAREDETAPIGTPLHLSAREFQQHLSQIESYFRVEYSLLLQQAADLAAKSVVLAGDDASMRLEQMKAIGFGQLGHVETINFDRILWVFFAISLIGFLIIFFWPRTPGSGFNIQPDLMARIAFVTSLATLTGAIFGSNRRLANRQSTPWSAYLAAGLIGVGWFVAVHGTSFLVQSLSESTEAAGAITSGGGATTAGPADAAPGAATAGAGAGRARPPFSFLGMLPWAVSPFFLAITICWLARQPSWPRPAGVPVSLWERPIDGAAIAATMVFAQITSYALHQAFDTPFAAIMAKRMLAEGAQHPIVFLLRASPSMLLGFMIGAIIVRDVRRAAHAQLTDAKALDAFIESERIGAVTAQPGYSGEAARRLTAGDGAQGSEAEVVPPRAAPRAAGA